MSQYLSHTPLSHLCQVQHLVKVPCWRQYDSVATLETGVHQSHCPAHIHRNWRTVTLTGTTEDAPYLGQVHTWREREHNDQLRWATPMGELPLLLQDLRTLRCSQLVLLWSK